MVSNPHQVLNAVIFSRNLQSLPEARSWEGRFIKVHGKIHFYNGEGTPEIILERSEQVMIDSPLIRSFRRTSRKGDA
jgi:exonuclease VII large subunit